MNTFACRFAVGAFALLMVTSPAGTAASAPPPGSASRGQVVYERYCVSCHGSQGDGAGEAAEFISPKPRDFRQGMFKWRSTPSGNLPTVGDLEKTITDGVYGTHMPTWYTIGHRNRLDVISYIQTFSSRWSTEEIPPSIVIPPPPPRTAESLAAGKALYDKLECAKCHGDGGKGDGPSSHELKNDWGDPIVPADLTAGHFKCGGTPADIYRVFMTGLNGTPMPSYVDSIKPDEAWQLVHYIESLSTSKPSPMRAARLHPATTPGS
jgi:cytochrome c oxidase cbb3-type subunit I/II